MWRSCFHHWRNLIVLLSVCGVMQGCASTPTSYQTSREEGIQFARPNPGTRVVVRGNHLGAVNHALGWLNGRQLLVVNRLVEKEAPGVPPRGMTALQNQALAVAQKVGATLVVFVHVNETSLNHTEGDATHVSRQPVQTLGVEIQGMNVKTGEVAFGANAWSSEPLVASERVVEDLTILALEKAWQEPNVSRSPQKEGTSEIQSEKIRAEAMQAEEIRAEEIRAEEIQTAEKAANITAVPTQSSDASPVDQSVPAEPMAPSQEQVTVFTEPRPEETSPAPVVTQPEADEHLKTSEDPSLGLQIASGALSILYTPLKIVYAGLGGFMGAFAYALTGGNEQVAQSVWDASLGGTYLLTPDHLQGHEPIRFKGESTN